MAEFRLSHWVPNSGPYASHKVKNLSNLLDYSRKHFPERIAVYLETKKDDGTKGLPMLVVWLGDRHYLYNFQDYTVLLRWVKARRKMWEGARVLVYAHDCHGPKVDEFHIGWEKKGAN